MLDLPVLGATTSYGTSTTLLTAALSSTSMPVMGCTLLKAICVAFGAETTWITRGCGLHASCTNASLEVLKLLDFTSFEDTGLIPWDKAEETLLRLATTPGSAGSARARGDGQARSLYATAPPPPPPRLTFER